MPRRILFLLPALLLLCAAGAARAQAPDPCSQKPAADSDYYADMKELPPGKFGFDYIMDMKQYEHGATPVVLRGMTGVQHPKLRRAIKLDCPDIENRTERVVKSVQLRWDVREWPADGKAEGLENAPVLAKGVLPAFEVEVAPGGRRKAVLRGVNFADFFAPLASGGEVNGHFHVTFGVAHVEFADGTSLDLP
jgi:hypothetical protein